MTTTRPVREIARIRGIDGDALAVGVDHHTVTISGHNVRLAAAGRAALMDALAEARNAAQDWADAALMSVENQ